jgi:hypothetical protein
MQRIHKLVNRQTLLILGLVITLISYGQNNLNPNIRSEGQTIRAFIPTGWKLLDSASGDLNKDGWNDVAIVIETIEKVNTSEFEEDHRYTSRILLILWNRPEGGYKLVARNNRFITEHDNPQMDEPFEDIVIKNGTLRISFKHFYSIGSWYTYQYEYIFRYQGNQFALIGAQMGSFHRATHESEEYSYNFSTKKRSLTVENEKGKRVTWNNISVDKLKTLDDPQIPYQWEVEKGVFL